MGGGRARDKDAIADANRATASGCRLSNAARGYAHPTGPTGHRLRQIDRGDGIKVMAEVAGSRQEGRFAIFVAAATALCWTKSPIALLSANTREPMRLTSY